MLFNALSDEHVFRDEVTPSLAQSKDLQKPALAGIHPLGFTLIATAWLGLIIGTVEGAALLLFQRINWARWGAVSHVSADILWISPTVDLIFFLLIVLVVVLAGRVFRRVPVLQATVFLLVLLGVHDWLGVTERLSRVSCWLLALGIAAALSRWIAARLDSAVRFWRTTLPWIVAAVVGLAVAIHSWRALSERNSVRNLPPPRPDSANVLVIVVDTLRADHLSSYGYARPTSPNIDTLAAQGVLFEDALSTSSWSLPSHVSLLTGQYQFEHGVENVAPLPVVGSGPQCLGGASTLGEVLERRGYRTGAFSANRTYFTGNLGFSRSFIHFEDYFHSPADMFLRTFLGRQLATTYLLRTENSKPKRLLRWLGFNALLDDDGNYSVKKRAPVVNQELLAWIDRDHSRPFFAFLNYFDVHSPYGAPRSYAPPPWPQESPIDQYDDGIKYMDDAVGELMSALGQRGLSENTIVVFTSDHGESLGQHHVPTHAVALYRELIQVPLIFWYPGRVPPSVRLAGPVSNAAIPATLVELVGGDGANPFPRGSLVARWTSGASDSTPGVLAEIAADKYHVEMNRNVARYLPSAIDGAMKSLVTPEWHLIQHMRFGCQLYDWQHDPEELYDLANTAAAQKVMPDLEHQLAYISSRSERRSRATGEPEVPTRTTP